MSQPTSQKTSETDWAYYKLYPGRDWNRHESLLIAACDRLYARRDVDRVFFLRYFDARGLHLRLRARPVADAAAVTRAIGAELDALLANVDALSEDGIVSAIKLPAGTTPGGAPEPGIVADAYEPEIAKFGARGIAIAETLFDQSSRLVYGVLCDERAGLYSRKTIVPRLMYDCVRDLDGKADDPRFWEGYAAYWLGGQTHWLAHFRAKAAELAAAQIPVVIADADLPVDFIPRLDGWRTDVARAGAAYRQCQPDLMGELPSQMVHLTNNRLGVSALEEAYYSILIAESVK